MFLKLFCNLAGTSCDFFTKFATMTTSLLKNIKSLSLWLVVALSVSVMTSCHSSRTIAGSSGRVERAGSTSHDNTVKKTSGSSSRAKDKKAAAREAAKVEVFSKVDRKSLDAVTRALLDEADSWRGTPYLWGGNTREGVDCSGFVLQVFKASAGIPLPRVSGQQYEYCQPIDKGKLEPGDLVFFATSSKHNGVSHVGIYIGNGFMIHSSSSKGVIVSDLNSNYYSSHYYGGGRVERFYAMAGKDKGKKRSVKDTKSKKPKQPSPTPAVKPSTPPRRDSNTDVASSTPARRNDKPKAASTVKPVKPATAKTPAKKEQPKTVTPAPAPAKNDVAATPAPVPLKQQPQKQQPKAEQPKPVKAVKPQPVAPQPQQQPMASTRPAHQPARQQPAAASSASIEDLRNRVLSGLDDDLFN